MRTDAIPIPIRIPKFLLMKNRRRRQRPVPALLENEGGVADVGVAGKPMATPLAAVRRIIHRLGEPTQTPTFVSPNR